MREWLGIPSVLLFIFLSFSSGFLDREIDGVAPYTRILGSPGPSDADTRFSVIFWGLFDIFP